MICILSIIRNDDRGVDYAEFPEFWELLHEGDDTVIEELHSIKLSPMNGVQKLKTNPLSLR